MKSRAKAVFCDCISQISFCVKIPITKSCVFGYVTVAAAGHREPRQDPEQFAPPVPAPVRKPFDRGGRRRRLHQQQQHRRFLVIFGAAASRRSRAQISPTSREALADSLLEEPRVDFALGEEHRCEYPSLPLPPRHQRKQKQQYTQSPSVGRPAACYQVPSAPSFAFKSLIIFLLRRLRCSSRSLCRRPRCISPCTAWKWTCGTPCSRCLAPPWLFLRPSSFPGYYFLCLEISVGAWESDLSAIAFCMPSRLAILAGWCQMLDTLLDLSAPRTAPSLTLCLFIFTLARVRVPIFNCK